MAEDISTSALTTGNQTKTIATKRSHKKSRFGCISCKQRKVKCDEGRPQCRPCKLRQTTCEYGSAPRRTDVSSEKSLVPISSNAASRLDTIKPANIIHEPVLCSPSIDVVDAKLLWFYTSATYKSLSYSDDKQNPVNDMLQTVVVQHAFDASFLMDSLLELASLHMQSLGQAHDPTRVLVYRARSFEGYRKAIETVQPSTYGALLANSVLRPMLSTQFFRDLSFQDLYLPDWMLLWRGVEPILQIINKAAIASSGMQPLFNRPPSEDPDAEAAAIPKQLLLMMSFIDGSDDDALEMQIYQESLRALGSLFSSLKKGMDSIMVLRIVIWATFVPYRLIELARTGRPRALVVLAHYAVFLKLVRDIWWLVGVGDRSLRDICHFLGPKWHRYLGLPLSALLADDAKELAGLILASNDES